MSEPTNQRSKRIAAVSAGLLVLLLHGAFAAARGRRDLVTPYVTGHVRSPDRRYRVKVVHDDGDTTTITVVGVKTGREFVSATDVDGFHWVPGSPHRLVVGASGLYGQGMLAMWEGGTQWRALARVRDLANEAFTLYDVSRDGCFITYGHRRNIAGDLDGVDETEHRHRLCLPPRRRRP